MIQSTFGNPFMETFLFILIRGTSPFFCFFQKNSNLPYIIITMACHNFGSPFDVSYFIEKLKERLKNCVCAEEWIKTNLYGWDSVTSSQFGWCWITETNMVYCLPQRRFCLDCTRTWRRQRQTLPSSGKKLNLVFFFNDAK